MTIANRSRFPIVSGLAVDWDHRKPPGKRINSIHLTVQATEHHDDELEDPSKVTFVDQPDGTRIEVKEAKVQWGEEVKNVEGGRMYSVITRDYMAQGFDGFEALRDRKFIIDHEVGQSMSSIVRSFLLGSSFIFRKKQLADAHEEHLCTKTLNVLKRARAQHRSPVSSVVSSPLKMKYDFSRANTSPLSARTMSEDEDVEMASSTTLDTWSFLRRHVVEHDWVTIREALHIAKHEHMSEVDPCNGGQIRRQTLGAHTPRPPSTPAPGILIDPKRKAELKGLESDVAIVAPQVDGRMRDAAASEDDHAHEE